MLEEIICAGFGGQGVLLLGEVLAIGTIIKGMKATWLPSYGPEMRGGTASCSVVLSSEPIGCPMVDEPSILVCFNQPSLDKFMPSVSANTIVFANDDTIESYPENCPAEIIKIKANTEAAALGNERALNIVMLGAMLKRTGLISVEDAKAALTHIWGPAKTEKLMPLNEKALMRGMELV